MAVYSSNNLLAGTQQAISSTFFNRCNGNSDQRENY